MNQEIERKFFLSVYPQALLDSGELKLAGREVIEQTYLALTETEEIRIRRLAPADGGSAHYTHTYKRGHGLSRGEAEYDISEEIYNQLLEGSGRLPLIKTRTKVLDASGRLFEIDDYHQFKLKTVEAEFTSVEEAERFAAPDWFGEEVGSQQEYRNKTLWREVQGIGD